MERGKFQFSAILVAILHFSGGKNIENILETVRDRANS